MLGKSANRQVGSDTSMEGKAVYQELGAKKERQLVELPFIKVRVKCVGLRLVAAVTRASFIVHVEKLIRHDGGDPGRGY